VRALSRVGDGSRGPARSRLLLRNGRAEWELPPVPDCWQYHIGDRQDVVIVTYGCHVASVDPPIVSSEHSQAGLFSPVQVRQLPMPGGYERSVTTWLGLIADGE
jgi:hypothetical protein